MMKFNKAKILIISGIILYFLSAIASDALSTITFDRFVSAGIIVDESTASGLDFANFLPGRKSLAGQHDVNVWVGSITNTGTENVDLYIFANVVSVIDAQNQNLNWTNTITVDGKTISFSGVGYTVNNGFGSILVTIPVNSAVDIYSKITLSNRNHRFEDQVAFSFYIDYGLYSMNPGDTIIQSYFYTR